MMNPSASSDFYLERVGFEVKVSFRHNLKGGENLVGRSDTHGVHIGINSMLCSRRHCVLSVTDDGVSLEDLRVSLQFVSVFFPYSCIKFILNFVLSDSHQMVLQSTVAKYKEKNFRLMTVISLESLVAVMLCQI